MPEAAHGLLAATRGLLLALLSLLAGALQAQGVTVVDDRGRSVTLAHPPQRIVSLLPSLTETVCELGACSRLVGVDRYSNYPELVRGLPQVGGGLDPSVEAIVALKPDLVLAAKSARVNERLESLGVTVVALEPQTAADVRRVLGTVGEVLGVPDAQRVWRAIDAAVLAAAQSLPPRTRGVRVYFEVNRGPYAAGASSFIGETMARLGLRNIIPLALGTFPKVNPEFVVRADPDVIMVSAREADALAQRPGWGAMRAIRERRLCLFTPTESEVLVRPGPRMAQAAQLVARCIREKAP